MRNSAYTSRFIIGQILRYAFEANKTYTALFIFVPVISGSLPFLSAYLVKLVIDEFVEGIDQGLQVNQLLTFAALFILTDVIRSMLDHSNTYIGIRLKDDLALNISTKMFRKIDRMKFSLFEQNATYDVIQRCTASIDWRPLYIIQRIPEVLTAAISVILALLITLSIGWWVAPVIILSTVPQLLLANKIADLRVSISDVRSPVSRKYRYFQNLLTSNAAAKEIRLFDAFPRLFENVRGIFDTFASDRVSMGRKKFLYDVCTELLQLLTVGGTIIYLFLQTVAKTISIGSLTFYIEVAQRLRVNTARLLFGVADVREHTLFLEPFFELLTFEEESQGGRGLQPGAFSEIEFKDVWFQYSDRTRTEDVLKGINLKIRKGEHLAIVGLNGAGKTTLIKLLLRFYTPQKGQILLDGSDASGIDKKVWFKNFCVLFQDFVRYALTARENIEFGDPAKNDRLAYENAKKKSDADGVIGGLKHQDEQMLTHQYMDGTDLSGGQWQRIALARAYYRDAPILILDEPTAAIDALSEAKIFDNVQQLAADRTVIIISHRFSTVRKAKRIIVLENGNISEEGSHEELLELGGKYSEMFRVQAKGYQ